MKAQISAVPTHIITGFLGVGKTSAILHLLKEKPTKERWAVLVNEFGETGIDGALLTGQHSTQQGVFVREIPGGCMCCAANLPMQIALNQLLIHAKADRLLIEPTGLGHPLEILQILSGRYYKSILDLQKTLTLVDARKLADKRYTEHKIFNQQISIADIIVGNKLDLYQEGDKSTLEAYTKQYRTNKTQIIFTQHAEIALEHLDGKTSVSAIEHHYHPPAKKKDLPSEAVIPECGYIKALNKGEDFHSIGWRFSPKCVFNDESLFAFLAGINAERIKAVFITEQGAFAYNLTADTLAKTELNDCLESRIEIIASNINKQWETQLMACIISS